MKISLLNVQHFDGSTEYSHYCDGHIFYGIVSPLGVKWARSWRLPFGIIPRTFTAALAALYPGRELPININ